MGKSGSRNSKYAGKFAPTHRSRDTAHAQWLQTPSACQCWDYAIEDTQPIFRGGPDPYSLQYPRGARGVGQLPPAFELDG